MTKTERLFDLTTRLQNERMTIQEIADLYLTSTRTAKRDIEDLRELIEVYYELDEDLKEYRYGVK